MPLSIWAFTRKRSDNLFGRIQNPILRETLDWGAHILIALALGYLTVNFVLQRTIVQEYSMEPTLHQDDNLWVEKLSPRFGWLKRGDIVTIYAEKYLEPGKKYLIKRVIARENEKVEFRDGKVFVNDRQLEEDYTAGAETLPVKPEYNNIEVPEGFVYVLGDNRGKSLDSRTIGPVPVEDITGKAFLRFWPFRSFGFIVPYLIG